MSIWDQLAAATADFSIRSVLHRDQKQDRRLDEALPFTVGMISLAAKMAKADGVVTKDEVHAFKKAFKVSDAEMKDAARAFNLAKQDVAGYETCAEELVAVFRGDRKCLSMYSKVSSTSLRPTVCSTLRRKHSLGRSRNASVSLMLSSPS